MEWHELRDALAKDSKLRHESRPEYGYARIVIDLGDAENVGTNIPFSFSGDQLAKIKYDGNGSGTYFRLNNKHAQQIYAAEFRRTNIPFTKIYLTNPTAQTGKTFSFYVGSGVFAAVQPSTGSKAGLVDSDGADINPAEGHAEDVAHTSGDKGVMVLAVRKSTPVDLSGTDGDYEPLQIDEGNLWVRTEIDAGGELQKIKEELEKILLDTAAIELATADIELASEKMQEQYSAVNRELTVAMGRGLTLTGTADTPTAGNDNLYAGHVGFDADDETLIFTFTKPVLMKQFRMYGDNTALHNVTGDGRFDIYYWDEAVNNYVLWKYDLPIRQTADWSAWEEVSVVSALKIKIQARIHDTGGVGGSALREIEFKY